VTGSVDAKPFGRCDNRWVTTGWGSYLRTIRPFGGNQELAERVFGQVDRLRSLVNNVGGSYNDRSLTDDGYEATLAMNFIGPFALTEALLPALVSSAPARVVNLASAAHAMWKGDPLEDAQSQEAYLGLRAYARTKLLNLLWTFALARRLGDRAVS